MNSKNILLGILLAAVSSCVKNDIDTERPVIDSQDIQSFPLNCDTVYFGEAFIFNTVFRDNAELGSYRLDIHHNFDHHNHTTDVLNCELFPIKDPVNPFTLIFEEDIPEGLQEFHAFKEITIPEGNFDEGEYHLFISLTDHEGWRDEKGISLRILSRQVGENKGLN